MKNKGFLTMGCLLMSFLFSTLLHAASTDRWVGKAVNTANALARGNVAGAAEQTMGRANLPLTRQTDVSVSPRGVGLRQGIKPLSFNNPYLNFGSTYRAGAGLNRNGTPNLSQNVQVTSRNPYFSNTTTFSKKINNQ